MDEVFVPQDHLLPGVSGLKGPFTLPRLRTLRNFMGRARRSRELLAHGAQYVLDRKQFGRPLAANQLDSKETGRHANRDHPGAAGLLAARAHEG